MKRRQVLRGIGAGSVVVLAGCGGGGGDGGSGDDGSGGATTTTGSMGGGATDTPPETTTELNGSAPTETEAPSTTVPSAGGPPLGEFATVESNYRMRVQLADVGDQGGSVEYVGVVTGEGYDLDVTAQGQSFRIVSVGGTTHAVFQGQCVEAGMGAPDLQFDESQWADSETVDRRLGDNADLQPAGEDAIDGESMWVYELTPTQQTELGTLTYYISQSSGYLRRVEGDGLLIEYWDWGQVSETISAPC